MSLRIFSSLRASTAMPYTNTLRAYFYATSRRFFVANGPQSSATSNNETPSYHHHYSTQTNNNNNSSISRRASVDSEMSFGIRRKGVPIMDMVELLDEPGRGSMVRAVYFARCVELAHYPQIGPRKTDPNDPMPQFDYKQRAYFRLNKSHMANILAVCEGKCAECVIVAHYGGKLIAKLINESHLQLQMDLPERDGRQGIIATIDYKAHYLPSFRYFLEYSLAKSFGFESLNNDNGKSTNQRDQSNRSTNNTTTTNTPNNNNNRRNNNNNNNTRSVHGNNNARVKQSNVDNRSNSTTPAELAPKPIMPEEIDW